jgi:MFS transporter, DHA1 family, inner membrane transport protein
MARWAAAPPPSRCAGPVGGSAVDPPPCGGGPGWGLPFALPLLDALQHPAPHAAVLAPAPPPKLPIGLFALAGFTTGSGMRVLDPVLPVIAAELSVSVSAATGVVAGFLLPYGLVQVVAGPLGDRLGKPRVACAALVVYALAMLGSALASGLVGLVAFRAVAGLAAGAVIPLLMAHLGDAVPYEERQGAIGKFLTGMVMAQLITGPATGVIAEAAGWRLPFALLGLLALAVASVMAAWLGKALWRRDAGPAGGRSGAAGYAALLARPTGRRLLVLAFFDGACLFGGAFPFVGSLTIERFGLNAAEAGLIVAGFGLGAFAYTRLARRLVQRFGERGLLRLGGIGLAIGLAGLAVAPSWSVVAALQVGLGFAFYLFHGVLQTRATEALPEARGTAVGGFALSLFLGQSAGSLAFGLVLALAGYGPAFGLATIGVLALAVYAAAGRGG